MAIAVPDQTRALWIIMTLDAVLMLIAETQSTAILALIHVRQSRAQAMLHVILYPATPATITHQAPVVTQHTAALPVAEIITMTLAATGDARVPVTVQDTVTTQITARSAPLRARQTLMGA